LDKDEKPGNMGRTSDERVRKTVGAQRSLNLESPGGFSFFFSIITLDAYCLEDAKSSTELHTWKNLKELC